MTFAKTMPKPDDSLPPLDQLQRKIDKARPPSQENASTDAGSATICQALRFTVELVSGVAVGAFIGYFLDRWLGTFPWLFILFFFLGAAAGFRNLLREAGKNEEK